MNKQKGFTLPELGIVIWFFLWAGIAIGWVMNLIRLVAVAHAVGLSHMTLFIILRIVGIFAFPLGGILGYIPN